MRCAVAKLENYLTVWMFQRQTVNADHLRKGTVKEWRILRRHSAHWWNISFPRRSWECVICWRNHIFAWESTMFQGSADAGAASKVVSISCHQVNFRVATPTWTCVKTLALSWRIVLKGAQWWYTKSQRPTNSSDWSAQENEKFKRRAA